MHDDAEAYAAAAMRRSAVAKARSADSLGRSIAQAAALVADCLAGDRTLLVAGNGGSAADAQHLAAEFTGRYRLDRRPLPAVALTTDTSALTAIANDYGYDHVFSRQVAALGRPGDVLVALSTSGTSPSIVRAIAAARERGLGTVLLTGRRPVERLPPADVTIAVPAGATNRIQESHLTALHVLTELVEARLMEDDPAFSTPPFRSALSTEELMAYRAWTRRQGLTVVSTNGCFDVVHRGHVASLRAAGQQGDELVVLVNDDASVRRLKGAGRPVVPLADRLAVIASMSVVSHVVAMADDDPSALLTALEPDVHCKGRDYEGRPMPEREIVESAGGVVRYLDLVDGVSTTAILAHADD